MEESRDNTAKLGFVAFGIVLAGAALVGGVAYLASGPAGASGLGGREKGATEKPPKASRPSGKYPYPECEEIVRHIKKNANDPASVEIVEWESRDINPVKDPFLTVRYRERNSVGAIQIHRSIFVVNASGGREVTESSLD